jgi:hypothetical protein
MRHAAVKIQPAFPALFALTVAAALGALASHDAVAQTFKCRDAAGRITYSGRACNELGLKDAGEVPDRLNTSPAYRAPDRPAPAPAPKAEAPAKPAESAEADKAKAEPERRCFTVKTAKGNVTRCNDTPTEEK